MQLQVARALLCLFLTAPIIATARQAGDERARWNQPFAPFRIIGNVHYVGATGVSAFLITSDAGSILIDGGLPETAPQIAANIASLGFKLRDVKYLLNSHAHFDHAGGLTELARLSGATVVASAGDAETLKAGSRDMPAVTIGRVVKDGDTVKVGDITMTARVTPGHTPGCTTWTTTTTENGRSYGVIFYCSTSVVDKLVGNTRYPGIVQDYERSFAAVRAMKADVFLAPHPDFFEMERKRKQMSAGAVNPFIDATELGRFVDRSEQQFRTALKKEQAGR
jgi:metallo-beta-lactamase class B